MSFQTASLLVSSLRKRMSNIQLYVVSTTSMMVGLGAQSVAFVVVARHLGKAQFGQLATVTAAASLGAAWAQLGAAELMRRRVGRDVALYRQVLGHCVILIFGWGSFIAILFTLGISLFVHTAERPTTNLAIVGLLVVSNIVMYPWITLTEQIFLTRSSFIRANLTNAGFGVLRAITAFVACSGFSVDTLDMWTLWNFGTYLLGSIACALAVCTYGSPCLGILREEIPIGVTFGITGFLATLRANVDVLSLGVIAPTEVVGTYGLARRVISIAVVTAASLDRLVYSRLVVTGRSGPSATIKLAYRYAIYAASLGGATALVLYLIAGPLLPLIFGSNFMGSIRILKMLCWILPLLALQNIAFDALNAANLHGFQTTISTITVLFGATVVFALTYRFSLEGTLLGIYILEILLAIALWTGLVIISGRRR